MSRRHVLGVCLIVVILSPAFGQAIRPHRGGPGGPPQGQQTDLDGTVLAVAPGRIQVSTNTNQTVVVMVQPGASQIHLTGTATLEYLKAGLCVELTATVEKNGEAKEPVKQLTVFTPSQDRQLGLFPEGAAGPAPGGLDLGPPAKIGGDAGIGPGGGGPGKPGRKMVGKPGGTGDLLGGLDAVGGAAPTKPGRRPHGKQAAGDALGTGGVQLPGTVTVRGQVKSCKANKLTVATGRGVPIKVDLADNAQISVDVADYSMATKGDKISVKGQPMGQFVRAESVKIEAVQPLTGGKKHATRAGAERPAKAEKPAGKLPSKKEAPAEPAPADKLDLPGAEK